MWFFYNNKIIYFSEIVYYISVFLIVYFDRYTTISFNFEDTALNYLMNFKEV